MTKPVNDISAEEVRKALHYDAETGVFRRNGASAKSGKHGRAVGWINATGYLRIGVRGRAYMAHRLAWLYVHGEWPRHQVDHIDGCRTNNRIANLRDVTHAENCQNLRKAHSKSSHGFLGAARYGSKWTAFIQTNHKKVRLGVFESPEQAHEAYVAAKRQLHAVCTL